MSYNLLVCFLKDYSITERKDFNGNPTGGLTSKKELEEFKIVAFLHGHNIIVEE